MFKNKLNRSDYSFGDLILLHNAFLTLLNNKDKFNHRFGLCYWITYTFGEESKSYLLDTYINTNLPLIRRINLLLYRLIGIMIIYDGRYKVQIKRYQAYWWIEGALAPRVKYVEKHLKKINCEIERRSSILPLGPGVKLDDNGYYI